MKPTLFILAAGMGSRYGGLKQLDGLGPNGETIMDYSVFDAMRAGFGKIVFVIRHDFEADFRAKILSKYENHIPVEVVFQDIKNVPEGVEVNPERSKPWGTNHAVLMGKDAIKEPFGVINADDFYGAESFQILADFLKGVSEKKNEYCMVGFQVENTLSENGTVSRGLCKVDGNHYLTDVVECHGICRKGDRLVYELNGAEEEFPAGTVVSMNMWGFTPEYFGYSEKAFVEFLRANAKELKAEFYIPSVVNDLIKSGAITLKVLPTPSKWFGVTYAADRAATVEQINNLIQPGAYPSKLW
jgi:NDP-sugar pyrophosphorylase family protein